MKILQLCNKVPWPPDDGGRIAMLNMAKGFVDNGNEVFILGMSTTKHKTGLKDIPESIKSKIEFNIVDVPAKAFPLGAILNLLFSSLPYTASRFISDDFSKQLTEILKKREFDIIQLEGLYLVSYIPLIRKMSSALISLRAHNIEHEIWQRTADNQKSVLRRLYYNNLAARIRNYEVKYLNSYDILVPITERDAKEYEILGNIKPVIVSQTGINIFDVKRDIEEIIPNSVFHIGALDWPPNQEGILWFIKNIWSVLYSNNDKLVFHIAGRNAPGWLVEDLKKIRGVIYEGEVNDAYDFMASKQIMVVPLLSGSGMRIKIIEGMAMQKCIVSTSIGAEGINVKDGDNILIADSNEDFISKIEELINNSKLQNAIGKSAGNFIKSNFENKTIIKKLLDYYSNKLNE